MRRAALIAAICAALLLPGTATQARKEKGKRNRGAVVAPVRLVPTSSVPSEVSGLHSYYGTVELRAASDGIVVVDRLPLERYLLGLNEVPLDWPMEALRAQAVAARTYAVYTLEQPRGGAAATYGFDICASVECQVFSGADVVLYNSDARRWVSAVESTAGEVVQYDGDPILARYHSTSGGRTFDNEQIFPSEGAFPYLKGVESITEDASPLYRWYVRFRPAALQRILVAGGAWERRLGNLRSVRSVPSAEGNHYADVVLSGTKRKLRMTAEELRVIVRTYAPSLYPARYPSAAPTSAGRLPETFPSNRYDVSTTRRRVNVVGRGWGHGVGMSQWGAEGMARGGASYEEILLHYYTGVGVAPYPDPGQIAVGVDWGEAEVAVRGHFDVVDGNGRRVVRDAVGTWRFRDVGDGAVEVIAPAGVGLPLRAGIASLPRRVAAGEVVAVSVALSSPARIRFGITGENRAAVVRDAGKTTLRWRAPRTPGTYEVVLSATNGKEEQRDRATVVVAPKNSPTPAPAAAEPEPPGGRDGGRPWWELVLALAVLIAVTFAGLKVTMRR